MCYVTPCVGKMATVKRLALLVGLAIVLSGCASHLAAATAAAHPSMHTLRITVVDNSNALAVDAFSSGDAALTITNQDGAIVASDPSFAQNPQVDAWSGGTTYAASVRVPTEAFYRLVFAGVTGGNMSFSLATVKRQGWHIEMSYGGP